MLNSIEEYKVGLIQEKERKRISIGDTCDCTTQTSKGNETHVAIKKKKRSGVISLSLDWTENLYQLTSHLSEVDREYRPPRITEHFINVKFSECWSRNEKQTNFSCHQKCQHFLHSHCFPSEA